ncbi:MAG: type II toxin-antitoxin system VapC family toxin [Halobaculum sp.]
MSGREPRPLFLDTSGLYAHFVDNAPRHDRARAAMEAIHDGELRYRPLYTSGYVLGELATLTLRNVGHGPAVEAVRRVQESSGIVVVHPDASAFDDARRSFARFEDQQISFVDHLSGRLADERGVEHVFGFDDDFRTLGFGLVPDDTGVVPETGGEA